MNLEIEISPGGNFLDLQVESPHASGQGWQNILQPLAFVPFSASPSFSHDLRHFSQLFSVLQSTPGSRSAQPGCGAWDPFRSKGSLGTGIPAGHSSLAAWQSMGMDGAAHSSRRRSVLQQVVTSISSIIAWKHLLNSPAASQPTRFCSAGCMAAWYTSDTGKALSDLVAISHHELMVSLNL